MSLLFFLISLLLNSNDSSLLIFRMQPISDISASADLTTVSLIERQRGVVSPSFLSRLNTSSFSGSFWKDYYGTGYFSFISFSHRIDSKSGAGFSYYGYTSGSEDVYYLDGKTESMVFEKDYMFSASYGFKINNNLMFGVRGKYISSTLAEKYSASTYAFDGDILFDFKQYMIRVGFENLGGNIKYISVDESLPFFLNLELSRYFQFRNTFLSMGVGMKKSNDYSISSLGLEISVRRFPLRLLVGYKRNKDFSQYFIGSGLMFENIYLSCSFGFPQIINSNEFKISLSYFFNPVNLFPSTEYKKQNVYNKRTPSNNTLPSNKPTKNEETTKPKPKKEKIEIILF